MVLIGSHGGFRSKGEQLPRNVRKRYQFIRMAPFLRTLALAVFSSWDPYVNVAATQPPFAVATPPAIDRDGAAVLLVAKQPVPKSVCVYDSQKCPAGRPAIAVPRVKAHFLGHCFLFQGGKARFRRAH